MSIERLPKTIKKGGFTFVQVARTGRKCLYEQHTGDMVLGYELFKVRTRAGEEQYPKDEDFGYSAWNLKESKDRALELFQQPIVIIPYGK